MPLASSEIKDARLRESYRKAVAKSSDSGATISAKELAKLIMSTFDGSQITLTEEADLEKILHNADLAPKARVDLNQFVANRKEMEETGLFRMSDSETGAVARAVGAAFHTGRTTFQDPVTMYAYHPHMYQDVARLIRTGFVGCFWHDASWDIDGKKFRGVYKSNGNRLVVAVSKRLGVHRESTMVHEATHCIQDMADMKIGRQYAEAAAHLAQTIMLIERDGGGSAHLFGRVAKMAPQAKKVINRGAITMDDWTAIIDAIKEDYPTNDIIDFGSDGGSGTHLYEMVAKWLLTETW